LLCCESTSEERSAGNRHATLCGSRERVTAPDDPVDGRNRTLKGVYDVPVSTSRVAEPSHADEAITRRLRDALALVDVRVLDHFVVAAGESASFAESGLI